MRATRDPRYNVGMGITRLLAQDFRGFDQIELVLHPQCTVVVGGNGSGKTSLLAALALAVGARVFPPEYAVVRRRAQGALLDADGEDGGITFRFPSLFIEPSGAVTAAPHGPHRWPPLGLTRFPDELDRMQGGRLQHDRRIVDWFRTLQGIELQRAAQKGDANYKLPALARVRTAVARFSGGAELVYDFESNDLGLRKDGDLFGMASVSTGEREIISLVCGVAMSGVERTEEEDGPAILLVDEIEAHLHPAWQRGVLPALRAAFPTLQIVVTTHSPQVVASVPAECVQILDGWKLRPLSGGTLGHDSTSVLRAVFGDDGRDRPVETSLNEVRRLLARRDVSGAMELLDRLVDPTNGKLEAADDPEVEGLRAEAFSMSRP